MAMLGLPTSSAEMGNQYLLIVLVTVGLCVAFIVARNLMRRSTPTGQTSQPDGERMACPMCNEEILADAKKCKHCGSMIGA